LWEGAQKCDGFYWSDRVWIASRYHGDMREPQQLACRAGGVGLAPRTVPWAAMAARGRSPQPPGARPRPVPRRRGAAMAARPGLISAGGVWQGLARDLAPGLSRAGARPSLQARAPGLSRAGGGLPWPRARPDQRGRGLAGPRAGPRPRPVPRGRGAGRAARGSSPQPPGARPCQARAGAD
jgi:hypothetical protein